MRWRDGTCVQEIRLLCKRFLWTHFYKRCIMYRIVSYRIYHHIPPISFWNLALTNLQLRQIPYLRLGIGCVTSCGFTWDWCIVSYSGISRGSLLGGWRGFATFQRYVFVVVARTPLRRFSFVFTFQESVVTGSDRVPDDSRWFVSTSWSSCRQGLVFAVRLIFGSSPPIWHWRRLDVVGRRLFGSGVGPIPTGKQVWSLRQP